MLVPSANLFTPTYYNIIAGTGLSGGGTMASDVPLSIAMGTTAGTVAAGDDARFTANYKAMRASDLAMTANASVSMGLSFPYAIGETWLAIYSLRMQSGLGVGLNFKFNTLPSGITGRMCVQGPAGALTAFTQQDTSTLTTATTLGCLALVATGMVQVLLTVSGGSGAGTIDLMLVTGLLQTGTVYKESSVVAWRV